MEKFSRIRVAVTAAAAGAAFLALPVTAAHADGTFEVTGPWRTSYEDAATDGWSLSAQCVELGGQAIRGSGTVVSDHGVPAPRYRAVLNCAGSLW